MDGKINRLNVITWRNDVTWVLPAMAVHVRDTSKVNDYLQQRLSGKTRAETRLDRRIAGRTE